MTTTLSFTTFLAVEGFEVIDSITSRAQTSLVAISFVVAGFAILRTAWKRNFELPAMIATAIVGGLVIWLVSGGYEVLGDLVDNEAENISEDIEGLG